MIVVIPCSWLLSVVMLPAVIHNEDRVEFYAFRRLQLSNQETDRQKKNTLQMCLIFDQRARSIQQAGLPQRHWSQNNKLKLISLFWFVYIKKKIYNVFFSSFHYCQLSARKMKTMVTARKTTRPLSWRRLRSTTILEWPALKRNCA